MSLLTKQAMIMLVIVSCMMTGSVVAAETLCSEGEQTAFSCALRNGKLVAVCASKDLSPTHGYVQYRFGSKNQPIFSLPASAKSSSRANVRAGSLMFAGGGGDYIRFRNGRYDYVVYAAVGKGWGAKDGVAVAKDGKIIRHFTCENVPTSKLGKRFFDQAGLPTDQEGFVVP